MHIRTLFCMEDPLLMHLSVSLQVDMVYKTWNLHHQLIHIMECVQFPEKWPYSRSLLLVSKKQKFQTADHMQLKNCFFSSQEETYTYTELPYYYQVVPNMHYYHGHLPLSGS